ncbi:E3 ubiquitin ligase BIG BROTHER [Spatholobus suberectus]|nr:E3 ubiquitin ligase BIG BROTHER [Spatholobus suberectus]
MSTKNNMKQHEHILIPRRKEGVTIHIPKSVILRCSNPILLILFRPYSPNTIISSFSTADKRTVIGICQDNYTLRSSLHLHARILLIYSYHFPFSYATRINATARLTVILSLIPCSVQLTRLLVWQIQFKMSWNPHMEVHYNNISYPYSTAGSFIEYVEGLTYEHVNFIFAGASHAQESSYPSTTSFYKSVLSGPGSTSCYRDSHGNEVNHHEQLMDEYRRPSENSATINEQMSTVRIEREEGVNNATRDSSIECPRRHHNNSNDNQVIWEDNIDPDNMTYEELLELGETVGSQSRGLSQEQISSLPVSKYKCGCFFFWKKSRNERCVICQMEYKRGDKRIALPCKHLYHASCGNRWLSINKACPICYTEVFADVSNHK